MNHVRVHILVAIGIYCLSIVATSLADEPSRRGQPTAGEELFARRVWPLFQARCLACHGNDANDMKGGYDLRSNETAVRGGESGEPSIVAGQPDASPLYLAVRRQNANIWAAMPPKENDKLTSEQVQWIREWIAAGAPWPDAARIAQLTKNSPERWTAEDGVPVATSGGLDDHWSQRRYESAALWAYRPVIRPALPDFPDTTDKEAASNQNPIERFLGAAQRRLGVRPAPAADAGVFLRRATLDLTGLPPTPQEIQAFAPGWEQDAPRAARQLVERLLASPHYGERQAQHWLDVTRFADTSGFSNDYERPGIWRYRDYVVRSFNADKPYDRFVLEQIAGDLLNPADPEMVVSVGFLRMGPWEATAMSTPELTRQQFLDDVVNHVGETFLAQGLRCAKCHDHKFDPVPTRDYYALMAAFGSTHPAESESSWLTAEIVPDGKADQASVAHELQRIADEMDQIGRKHYDAGLAWLQARVYDASRAPFKPGGFFFGFNSYFSALPEDHRPPRNIGLTPDDVTRLAVLFKRRGYLKRSLDRYEPVAYTVYSGPPNDYSSTKDRNPPQRGEAAEKGKRKNQPIQILGGGSLDAPLGVVSPGALSAVDSLSPPGLKWDNAVDPRLALARWIADARNPLTARVIVNRVWQQHFGFGLVATSNNFGKMGSRPSHPELLDYLAHWFVEQGWSLKKLHTLICTSEAYRHSARHPDPAALAKADALGQLLAAYPVRRLSAEEIRDAMLAASGELNKALGGPPIAPEINLEAALQPRYVMSGVAPAYQPSPRPEERHRRTLYAIKLRGLADPFQEVFDRPNADLSCERRNNTTVVPQVFALFHGVEANGRALALANRLERESSDPARQIGLAHELILSRPATQREMDRALAHVAKLTVMHRDHPPSPVPLPTSVRRSLVGEMTGEVHHWEEPLDIFAQRFVRDLQPWEASPETRALAAYCLVLFNSNAFLYVE